MKTGVSLDIRRYLGLWHEVARIDQPFQRDCVAATAEYHQLPSGLVTVTNTCERADGTKRRAQGTARPTDRPGELLVSFGGPEAQYLVELVTDDYATALVGNDARSALWILHRAPKMPLPVLRMVVLFAEALGYPTEQVIV